MTEAPLTLVPLVPAEEERLLPQRGRRIRWPGDDRTWEWTGRRWVSRRTRFDGGDVWRTLSW